MKRTITSLIGLILCFCVEKLHAENLILLPGREGTSINLRLKYGHGSTFTPPSPERITDLKAHAPDGKEKDLRQSLKPAQKDLVTEKLTGGGAWVFEGRYDGGVGTELGATVRRVSYAKAFYFVGTPTPNFKREFGHRLELVPASDPFKLGPGKRMIVKALLDGKMLPGANLEMTDGVTAAGENDRFVSDPQGIFILPVERTGIYVLVMEHKTSGTAPETAKEIDYSASLTFTSLQSEARKPQK